MKTLTLRNRFQGNSTLIENGFIDYYMSEANGEYVKVYLFLLRHLNNPGISLTISTIADCLGDTERDVLRALGYWETEGLLSIDYDEDGKVAALELLDIPASAQNTESGKSEKEQVAEIQAEAKAAPAEEPSNEMPAAPMKTAKERKELKQLLFVAEQYLGKTLSKTDVDTITYFHDGLQFSTDLIEYLIEYCVDNDHKSMHYIKSVALAWADRHISTVSEAKQASSAYNKNCYTVLKAFGISGRGPAAAELSYIKKWTQEYGFSLELIAEACDRTIASTHQPSFEYADTILTNWLKHKVQSLPDILALDEAYQKEKSARKSNTAVPKQPSTNKFNNFQGRTYDLDSLEAQLLKSK